MKPTRFLLFALILIALLTGCAAPRNAIEDTARAQMTADGFTDAAITQVSEGEAATRGADELHCVATDATTSTGLPYLVLVWRSGSDWQSEAMTEGYYEWDLYGCPR